MRAIKKKVEEEMTEKGKAAGENKTNGTAVAPAKKKR